MFETAQKERMSPEKKLGLVIGTLLILGLLALLVFFGGRGHEAAPAEQTPAVRAEQPAAAPANNTNTSPAKPKTRR